MLARSNDKKNKKSNVKPWHRAAKAAAKKTAPSKRVGASSHGVRAKDAGGNEEVPNVFEYDSVDDAATSLPVESPTANDDRGPTKNLPQRADAKTVVDAKSFPTDSTKPTQLPIRSNSISLAPAETVRKLFASNLPTELFRPTERSQLIGNEAAIGEMASWLDSPQRLYKESALQKPKRCAALLLSGPPGCGKTSAVRVLLRERGYRIREWSPAEPFATRCDVSQASMAQHFYEVFESTVFCNARVALVLEEIDGAVVPLNEMLDCLSRTRPVHNPVLMTCNSKWVPALKKLRDCPTVGQVRFWPLKEDELTRLWTGWNDAYRKIEREAGATPTRCWVSSDLLTQVKLCGGDARRLLIRDAESRRGSSWSKPPIHADRAETTLCGWKDVERWTGLSRDRRNLVLPEMASLWTEAKFWMGPRFRDAQLERLAAADRDFARVSRFADFWCDSEILDDASWCEVGASESVLAESAACLQLLLLRKSPSDSRRSNSKSAKALNEPHRRSPRRLSEGPTRSRPEDWDRFVALEGPCAQDETT